MRRVLIALGLAMALVGGMACWPLLRVKATHDSGWATVLAVLQVPDGDAVRLRVIYDLPVGGGRRLLADRQADLRFRLREDPRADAEEAEAAGQRLQADQLGRLQRVRAFWQANDPAATAFILDVTDTHPWRGYLAWLAVCVGGLIIARLAYAYGPRNRSA
jgi:hypothetical protein